MSGIAMVMAAALAAVLTAAAVGKIQSPATTAKEFEQLRIPVPGFFARAVPALELIVAAGLILRPTYGAPAAMCLLAAFTGVLIATVRSGRTVTCGCLGAIGQQPVTVATVARNLVFLAMAAAAATAPQPVLPGLADIITSATLLLLALILVQLLAAHQALGRIWSVELAGESPPRERKKSS